MSIGGKLATVAAVVATAAAAWIATNHLGTEHRANAAVRGASEVSSPPVPVASEGPSAPSRTPEAAVVAPAVQTKPQKDFLADYRASTLRGRVVDQRTRHPLVGVSVTAQAAALTLFGDLETVLTDVHGEFTLDRLGPAILMKVRAAGYLSFDVKFSADELAAADGAAPRAFVMERLTYGNLVCTLHARDGQPLPSRLLAGANVVYSMVGIAGYEHERFDRMPLGVANGPAVEMVIPSERAGGVFRIEHAPACTPIELFARLDHFDIGQPARAARA